MNGRWWLGEAGSEVLFETGWTAMNEGEFEISREGRVANGDLVVDKIATKKRWTITYAVMTQDTLDALMTAYNLGDTLSLIIERADLTTDTYTVKFRPFSRTRLTVIDTWLWKGATFVLEEV